MEKKLLGFKRRNKAEDSPILRQRRIAVISPGRDQGVSFVALLCARLLRDEGETSLAELGSPCFYNALGMERRFLGRNFINYFELLKNRKNLQGAFNREEGINWILRLPKDKEKSTPSELFRLISNIPGRYAVWDCSGACDGEDSGLLYDIAAEADLVIIVIDPLPSKLLESAAELERLRLIFPKAALCVNRMNKGVHKSQLEQYLGTRDFIEVPVINAEYIYRAEYACELPFELDKNFIKSSDKLKALLVN